MRVTFILRNLSDAFYDGIPGAITGLNALSDADKFAKLSKEAKGDLRHCVSMKIATGQFRDAVELNQMLRGPCTFTYKLEPRKGYKLATFDIERS